MHQYLMLTSSSFPTFMQDNLDFFKGSTDLLIFLIMRLGCYVV